MISCDGSFYQVNLINPNNPSGPNGGAAQVSGCEFHHNTRVAFR
jgi:hypothetical protein